MKKSLIISMLLLLSATMSAQDVTKMIVHKSDNSTVTFQVSDVDSITFETTSLNPDQLQLSCEVTELTPVHATYVITANQDQDSYYQFMMSEDTYNTMIERYGSLQDHDQAWWTELSTYYENTSWEDIMRTFLVKGTQTFQSEEVISSLSPSTTYVIYYYGLDENGDMTTEIGETRFTTPAPQVSDNSFTISQVTPIAGGVSFKVTPTTNDTYFVTAQTKSAVNNRLNSGMTMRQVAQDFINTLSNYGDITQYLHNGEETITEQCSLDNTDYVIIVCGYDGGVSTDVETAEFHSLP